MNNNLSESQTKINLLRAFAGESQARNRYTFAASQAKKENLPVIEMVFKFTADQEKEHAKVFYDFLKDMSGQNIKIDGSYPVDIYGTTLELLRASQHNEFEEFEPVYPDFGIEGTIKSKVDCYECISVYVEVYNEYDRKVGTCRIDTDALSKGEKYSFDDMYNIESGSDITKIKVSDVLVF